jgi:peptide deformylase
MLYLLAETDGLALAAPQVGIDARMFVTNWGQVFVNPGILRVEGKRVSTTEGCLSLPGVTRYKSRWSKIILAGGDVYEGGKAIVIQHEIDHLNGRLITDG